MVMMMTMILPREVREQREERMHGGVMRDGDGGKRRRVVTGGLNEVQVFW
jgi:hypothetical protein